MNKAPAPPPPLPQSTPVDPQQQAIHAALGSLSVALGEMQEAYGEATFANAKNDKQAQVETLTQLVEALQDVSLHKQPLLKAMRMTERCAPIPIK